MLIRLKAQEGQIDRFKLYIWPKRRMNDQQLVFSVLHIYQKQFQNSYFVIDFMTNIQQTYELGFQIDFCLVYMIIGIKQIKMIQNFEQEDKDSPKTQIIELRLIGQQYKPYLTNPELYIIEKIRQGNPWPDIPEHHIARFLNSITLLYSNVSYHNITHAFDHLDEYLIRFGWQKRLNISHKKRIFMLLAAYAHDAGHQGLTNTYYKNAKHPLAVGTDSPLQTMHANHLRRLLEQYKLPIDGDIIKELTEMILRTDNLYHDWLLQRADGLKGLTDSQLRQPVHSLTVECLLLHCADLNNTAKPTEVSILWTNLLYVQFEQQNNIQQKQGLPLTCHRLITEGERAQSNILFMDHMVLPLFRSVSELEPLFKRLVEQVNANKAYWQAFVQKMEASA